MFKIEVDVNGTAHGHYWMNRHKDDFLQFLPSHFTSQYGELITKEELTVFKFDEANKDLLEGKLAQHTHNMVDCSTSDKIKICRHDGALVNEGDKLPLAHFEEMKAYREAIFSDSATPQIVAQPSTISHDFGDGAEDAIEIPVGHELAAAYTTLELELTGTALAAWPYDNEGKFLGND